MDRQIVSKPAPGRCSLLGRPAWREARESNIPCVLGFLREPFACLSSVASLLLAPSLRADDPIQCLLPDHCHVLTSPYSSQFSRGTITPAMLDRFSIYLLLLGQLIPGQGSQTPFPCTTLMFLTNHRECHRSAGNLTSALRERYRLESASHHRDDIPCKSVCSQSNMADLSSEGFLSGETIG